MATFVGFLICYNKQKRKMSDSTISPANEYCSHKMENTLNHSVIYSTNKMSTCICAYVCVCGGLWIYVPTCRSQRTTYKSLFCPSTMGVSEISRRSTGLERIPSFHWAISPVPKHACLICIAGRDIDWDSQSKFSLQVVKELNIHKWYNLVTT